MVALSTQLLKPQSPEAIPISSPAFTHTCGPLMSPVGSAPRQTADAHLSPRPLPQHRGPGLHPLAPQLLQQPPNRPPSFHFPHSSQTPHEETEVGSRHFPVLPGSFRINTRCLTHFDLCPPVSDLILLTLPFTPSGLTFAPALLLSGVLFPGLIPWMSFQCHLL